MADTLKADLEIGDPKAAIDDLKRKLSAGLDGVKIGAGFTKEIQSNLDAAEKKALSLQSSLKSIALTDTKGKAFDWISKQAQSSQKEIGAINRQLQTISKLATQTGSKTLLKVYEDDARKLSRELDVAEKKLLRLQQARFSKPTSSTGTQTGSGGFSEGLISATGIPIGGAAAGAIIGAAVIKTSNDIVQAGKSGEGSLQQLISASKQAEVALDKMNAKTGEFARLTSQSDVAARSSYASIVEFSKQAGRIDQVDKLSSGLANLFAAKNISPDKMLDMLSQLKTGQDEVFDRLAGANPSKFYDEYARSIGTTAEKLTDAQKAQVRWDTIVKLSTIFDGTAEKRLKQMSGQLDSVAAGFENLYTRAGKAVAPFVKAQLENILNLGDFFSGKGLFASDEDKAKARAEAKRVADEQVKVFVESTKETQMKIDAAAKNPFASIENFALSKIDATKFMLESVAKEIEEIRPDGTRITRFENTGEIQARLQGIKDAATTAAQAEATAFKDKFDRVLADKNSSPSLLLALRSEFEQIQNILPSEVKEKFRREISDAVSGSIAKGFETALSESDQTADKLLTNLKKLQAGVSGLLPETTKKLIEDYEKAIKAMAEKAYALRDSIKGVLTDVAGRDNPLVKLLVDFESATERAEKRFGQFGGEIVKMMADIDKQMIRSQINQILYDGSKKALELRQEADRLGNLPETSTNQFNRRIGFLDARAENALRQVTRQRAVDDFGFYANDYNPNNPISAFQNKFGRNVSAFSGETRQILEEINAVKKLDLDGTGAIGKGLIAEKLDKIISVPQEELLKALDRGGEDAFNARKLLQERAGIAKDLQTADRAKFENEIAKDKAEQQNVRDAESLIKNLGADKGLTDPQKIKEFLAITGDLGTENLTPELLRARQQAIRPDAANTAAQAKEAATQAKAISDAMAEIDRQLKAGGLLVKNSETPIVDIEVHDGLSATQRGLGTRANNSNVRGLSE